MTEYAMFSTADLIDFASKRDSRTPLEQELAWRLAHAAEMSGEHDDIRPIPVQ